MVVVLQSFVRLGPLRKCPKDLHQNDEVRIVQYIAQKGIQADIQGL